MEVKNMPRKEVLSEFRNLAVWEEMLEMSLPNNNDFTMTSFKEAMWYVFEP